jgi:bifunctional N-acetylglucosamine-1-phosphate-uridyltransferase/glucosamine-1-phosphate-acetyltransferase GlmU-like protein
MVEIIPKPTEVSFDIKVDDDDIFVLVLNPENYKESKILESSICGRTVIGWLRGAIGNWRHKFADTTADDDVLTIFRENLTSAKWTVVIYADTPLLSANSISQAVEFASIKNAKAVALPRGWIFNTEFVNTNDDFEITEFIGANPEDYLVAFNDSETAKIRGIIQERINYGHIRNGCNIIAPNNTYIDCNVKIGSGTVIKPNTVIDADCEIGSNCQIGPSAHIRPNTKIGNNCKIGNFTEIKKSVIGDRSKVAHMTYIGDGIIGEDCNIGCGVIFCNYDGTNKNTTTIGKNVFIGSNSCLIAPVTVGDNAYIGAGSVITDTVPGKALAIARARQAVKENWASDN